MICVTGEGRRVFFWYFFKVSAILEYFPTLSICFIHLPCIQQSPGGLYIWLGGTYHHPPEDWILISLYLCPSYLCYPYYWKMRNILIAPYYEGRQTCLQSQIIVLHASTSCTTVWTPLATPAAPEIKKRQEKIQSYTDKKRTPCLVLLICYTHTYHLSGDIVS